MVHHPSVRAGLLLALMAALGWHVHARSRPEQELGTADRVLLSATGPVQSGLASALGAGGGLWARYFALVGVADENAELRAQNAAARGSVAELAELRRQNDRLRALTGLRARAPGRTVSGTVIGRGISPRFDTVRIDRGASDGVRRHMPVLSPEGAIGQVLRSSGGYSDILLVRDGLSGVGALVQRSRYRGVVRGTGDGLALDFVRRTDRDAVREGDVVVTSGEDGVFPAGVRLGTVVSAHEPETGMFLRVELEPSVSVSTLDEVLVLIEPPVGPFPVPLDGVDLDSLDAGRAVADGWGTPDQAEGAARVPDLEIDAALGGAPPSPQLDDLDPADDQLAWPEPGDGLGWGAPMPPESQQGQP